MAMIKLVAILGAGLYVHVAATPKPHAAAPASKGTMTMRMTGFFLYIIQARCMKNAPAGTREKALKTKGGRAPVCQL